MRQPLSLWWGGSYVSGARPPLRPGALPSGSQAAQISPRLCLYRPPQHPGLQPGRRARTSLRGSRRITRGGGRPLRGPAGNSCSPYSLEASPDETGCPVAHPPLLDCKLAHTFNGLWSNQTINWKARSSGSRTWDLLMEKKCGDKVDGSL